ncbi:DMT family transporter [Asticcacaulis sp. 201]|uniref:DMT family transporter n=1 Tax=Asticcacaulis sp. 201 TaxID=3028787 RepID=UPI002915EBE0|nr:DMT family transporter [Asticcacaulis sp. 201]MDV6329250.1 DMT family transporter [Asticcacaulis sp. 201]
MSDTDARSKQPAWFLTWGGYILAMLGAFLFASKGIWIKLAYNLQIDASSLIALRLAFATPFFVVFGILTFLRARAKGTNTLPPIDQAPGLYIRTLLVGALGYWVASYTDFESLTTLSPQFERLILFTYPLFVILFGALFFKQPFRLKAVSAFAISYAGLALVFVTDLTTYGSMIVAGALWCTISSVAFALYLLLAKPLIKRMGPSLFTSWAMSGAAIATGIHFLIVHRISDIHLTPPLLTLVIGLAIGATVLPSYLTNFALSRISSQANAIISFINPIFTLAMSALILKQHISLADVAGTILVLVGVGVYVWIDQGYAAAQKAAQSNG